MRLGSLCTGYGGLDLAVENVLGTELAWTSDIDKGANKIIAHRFGDVPNIGDLTAIQWTDHLEPVDVLTAGYPCQPFSLAGLRKGTDDERHLWPYIRQAIRVLRPRLTVLENVAGHRALGFDRVLGDMAEDGLHVRWTCLRASDVGAPHRRERIFIIASPDSAILGHEWRGPARGRRPGPEDGSNRAVTLLPTPEASRAGGTAERHLERKKLADGSTRTKVTNLDVLAADGATDFGDYAEAVARWADALVRPAPPPVEPAGKDNSLRLSPRFVEWMMGLPAGWVTDVPDLTRNEQLRALGNGVVPQQAEAALRLLLPSAVAA